MRKLLNTLYITNELAYCSLNDENIVILVDNKEVKRVPFVNFENIVCFNYLGCSPALMGKCGEEGIPICFLRSSGKFLARVTGPIKGNVHLRRAQFEKLSEEEVCLKLAQNVISAKFHNSRHILARAIRDHAEKIEVDSINNAITVLSNSINSVYETENIDSVRGYEGECSRKYFEVFNELIIKNKDEFTFAGRTKDPPLDKVNAMLSYFYTILTLDIQSALETVGLDPYIGFFHTDRSGRASLALDLIEELRAYLVDRFVLSMINLQQVKDDDFLQKEGGGIIMTDECRKTMITAWQKRKHEIITHSVIKEKIEIGLIPFVQANLLAKYIRGDIPEYVPYICE